MRKHAYTAIGALAIIISGVGFADSVEAAVRCRTVVVPGSGRGPERVCNHYRPTFYPRAARCRTIVVPGSGRGPERVCS